MSQSPRLKTVLIGGGHSHVVALRGLAEQPEPNLDLHLISPHPTATYSGLLPSYLAGHTSKRSVHVDLKALCEQSGTTFEQASAIGIDPAAKTVNLSGGRTMTYDIASLNIGAVTTTPNTPRNPDVAPVKPMEAFLSAWDKFLARIETHHEPSRALVVGGGVGGVEVALSIHHRLRSIHPKSETILVERNSDILTDASVGLRRHLLRALKAAGVCVLTSIKIDMSRLPVFEVTEGDTRQIGFTALVTGAKPHRWLSDTQLPLKNGFVTVDDYLRVDGAESLFCVGDTASFTSTPLPKAGVYAVRQGRILGINLAAMATGRPLKSYVPQDDYLKLVSLGTKKAVAEKWGIAVALPGLWSLKRSIDLKFTQAD